jgi:CDP-paratose 2-epimerase
MNKIFITGGAGFVGTHVAEFYAKKNFQVIVYDNLSRLKLLNLGKKSFMYNWNYLKSYANVKLIKGDVRNYSLLKKSMGDSDVVVHLAGQTAVTTSVQNPRLDFEVNIKGTLNVLEACRNSNVKTVIYSSTNKVYGANVNKVPLKKEKYRYNFAGDYKRGISEDFPIDHCEHTPYGCSKLSADIYMQDYHHLYGLKTGIFRMSCIYGTHQYGVEDQGWLAWFVIASTLNKQIKIYGDGKQVRDVLYVTDLVNLYDLFIKNKIRHGVFNTGGGSNNTLSLLELIKYLESILNKRIPLKFESWRPSDQKVYISNIEKAEKILGWTPKISYREGVKYLFNWVNSNRHLF